MAASQQTVHVQKSHDAELANATFSGDLDAAGGFRKNFGPFVRDNVAAGLTDSVCAVGATAAPQVDLVCHRAGSLVGISASFTVAPAGANLTVKVFKNGALLNAAAILTVVPGAPLGYAVTFAKDLYTLAAGDRVGIAITTPGGWTATTSDIAVLAEVEG
jgi:hypothetical protein